MYAFVCFIWCLNILFCYFVFTFLYFVATVVYGIFCRKCFVLICGLLLSVECFIELCHFIFFIVVIVFSILYLIFLLIVWNSLDYIWTFCIIFLFVNSYGSIE